MDYHHHARLTEHGREQMCRAVLEGRLSLCEAAAEHKISRQTASKWVGRYRSEGVAGLSDRRSRPHHSPRRTGEDRVARVETLRRERWTGVRIAQATGLSRATVSRLLTRLKLNKARHLEPAASVVRYEHAAPGEMLHIDIKKFARIVRAGHRITGNPQDETRGAGWEFLYVAVDDHSRIAYTAMMPDETAASSSRFLADAVVWFQRLGITVRRVLTDNGPCFYAHRFAHACRELAIVHKRTRIYTPAHQRQSRTLHPDSHPRVGLCPKIRKLSATIPVTPAMDPPVQLAQASCQPQPVPTHQPIRTRCQQPLDTPQLKPTLSLG